MGAAGGASRMCAAVFAADRDWVHARRAVWPPPWAPRTIIATAVRAGPSVASSAVDATAPPVGRFPSSLLVPVSRIR